MRVVRLGSTIVVAGAVLVGVGLTGGTTSATRPDPEHKVWMCHATSGLGELKNGYNLIEIDESAVSAHLAHVVNNNRFGVLHDMLADGPKDDCGGIPVDPTTTVAKTTTTVAATTTTTVAATTTTTAPATTTTVAATTTTAPATTTTAAATTTTAPATTTTAPATTTTAPATTTTAAATTTTVAVLLPATTTTETASGAVTTTTEQASLALPTTTAQAGLPVTGPGDASGTLLLLGFLLMGFGSVVLLVSRRQVES